MGSPEEVSQLYFVETEKGGPVSHWHGFQVSENTTEDSQGENPPNYPS